MLVQMIRYSSIVGRRFFCSRATPKDITDSGHGGQTEDLDGDEDDGYDEGVYRPPVLSISLIVISHLSREDLFLA